MPVQKESERAIRAHVGTPTSQQAFREPFAQPKLVVRPEPYRLRMANPEGLPATLQLGARSSGPELSDAQFQLVADGLQDINDRERILAGVVYRGLHSREVLQQLASDDNYDSSASEVLVGALRALTVDIRATVDAIETTKAPAVLVELRDRIPEFAFVLPLEDIELLTLLGTERPEMTVALALARARRELEARYQLETDILVNELTGEPQGPAPTPASAPGLEGRPILEGTWLLAGTPTPIPIVPYQNAPDVLAGEVDRIEQKRSLRVRWKGIFKMVQATVLGAGNLALGLSTALTSPVALALLGSLGTSIGSFGEAIDELSKPQE
jgi:hypothetical protein